MEWYYADENHNKCSITFAELEVKLRAGEIDPSTLVWRTGMAGWVAAKELPELANTLQTNDEPPALPIATPPEIVDPWYIKTDPCPECGHLSSAHALACPACLRELDAGNIEKQKAEAAVTDDGMKKAGAVVAGVADGAVKALINPMMFISMRAFKSIGKRNMHGARSASEKTKIKKAVKQLLALDCLAMGNLQMGLEAPSFLNYVIFVTDKHFVFSSVQGRGAHQPEKIRRDAMLDVSVTQPAEGKKVYGLVPYAKITYKYIDSAEKEVLAPCWFSGHQAKEFAERTAKAINIYKVS